MARHNSLLDQIAEGKIRPDDQQSEAIKQLQNIAASVTAKPQNKLDQSGQNNQKQKLSMFSRFTKKTPQKESHDQAYQPLIKGMYIWGEVGRGKTWLMDQFYKSFGESLNAKRVQRLHFHEFMLNIHKRLQDLPSQPDPLTLIGKNMAISHDLICLDEFHVMDIADAVILHGLLKALFDNGVTLVTTSNRHPDDLYKGGSHRQRFLPAIELIKQHTHVFHLDTATDYRKLQDQSNQFFLIPHNKAVNKQLKNLFIRYSGRQDFTTEPIKVYGREIPVVRLSKNCVWFDFDTICRGMRASSDYLQIAKQYKTVIISEVPVLHEGEEGPARRFLNLIDAFYDQHVYLILSSYVEIETMYQGELLQFEFKRALSRLHEMQSLLWWQDNKGKQ